MARRDPYPHLPLIEDWAAQSTLRLLWDRLGALREGTTLERSRLADDAETAGTLQGLLLEVQQLLSREGGLRLRKREVDPIGQLEILSNQYFAIENQPTLPIFCHYMEAFSRYTRNASEVQDQLVAIANAGYGGIRFLDILNNQPNWFNREVGPRNIEVDGVPIDATTDYYAKLHEFLLDCKSLGLRVNWSRGDLSPYSQSELEEHFTNLGLIAARVGVDVIAVFEAVNEYYDNGVDLAALPSLLDAFSEKAGTTMLRALSSPQPGPTGNLVGGALATHSEGMPLAMVHGDRRQDLVYKMQEIYDLRNGFIIGATWWPDKPVWQDEPPGSGTSTTGESSQMDEQGLSLMALLSLLCEQPYSVVLKNGVYWNSSLSSDVGFHHVPAAISLLPDDLMQWETLTNNVHSARADIEIDCPAGPPYLSDLSRTIPFITQRISLSRGKIAAVLYGGKGTLTIRARQRRITGSIYRIVLGAPYVSLVGAFDMESGGTHTLGYDPDTVRGCLIIGSMG